MGGGISAGGVGRLWRGRREDASQSPNPSSGRWALIGLSPGEVVWLEKTPPPTLSLKGSL